MVRTFAVAAPRERDGAIAFSANTLVVTPAHTAGVLPNLVTALTARVSAGLRRALTQAIML